MPLSNFGAGRRLYASELNALVTQINSLTAPGWTDYSSTFALTAPTTNPTKGNSTYSAWYRQPSGSDVIDVHIEITIGSTFVTGSGIYNFSLPVNAHSSALNGHVGSSLVFDTGTAYRLCTTILKSTSTLALAVAGSSVQIDNTGSGTAWAAGDYISIDARYRAA